ncbi:Flagellar motor protein MotA [Rhodovastum atsumiense]|uniref:Flagellar motor protein MotA n=1 Tax=Rhodovastum atsumiense TaxID=504468 RepID=A0A5M6J1I0_9PROT|nr:MotA/TolQ/ExbB proton channel family protein [Rhodovastum atsumiense]KAA5614069.1 flagellar motor protein MotA [Rhodovastum atsumiense]CAH2598887.1 Flagellar motor protein MotA [Rhodovastum atsumiense]
MPTLDLSLSGMLMQTTGPVRAVLVLLLVCSVLCWAIIFEKVTRLIRLQREARGFERLVRSQDAPVPSTGLATTLLATAAMETGRRPAGETLAERRERIERTLRESVAAALLPVETRLPVLATIGSAAPFIGLFGTVWGIMHAFAGLAQAGDSSLAAVAPGIAEALSTTAIGLAAALPASIAYNMLAGSLGMLARRLGLAVAALARQSAEAAA